MGRHSINDDDTEPNTVVQPPSVETDEVRQSGVKILGASYWTGVLDRAVKSFAQQLVLLWGADQGLDILAVDWRSALGLAGGAAVLSVLTSLASAPVGDKGSTAFLPGGA